MSLISYLVDPKVFTILLHNELQDNALVKIKIMRRESSQRATKTKQKEKRRKKKEK